MNKVYHCGENPKIVCKAATYGALELPCKTCESANDLSQIDVEIEEYQEMITHSIRINDKTSLSMWRRALQTAKITKRRLANS